MGNKDQVREDKRGRENAAEAADERNYHHAHRLDERALKGLGRMMPAKALDLKKRDREERADRDSDPDQRAVDKSKGENEKIVDLNAILPEIKIP